ncbi:MAG: replicative DNA helicase [Clostridiales bacterium]|jgi:replicative DNA helicase|nr:replicative DNA helicase [Clostridiales bacterium]
MDNTTNDQITRIPPHDTEAEQAVLSCMLSDNEALVASCEFLLAEDFYIIQNKELFRAMLELYVKNVPVDIVTLADKLKEKGLFDQTGGMAYLSKLVGLFYTSANIKQYNKIIKEKATLRRLVKAGADIADMSYAAAEEVDSIIEKAEKSIFNIVQNRDSNEFHHIHEVLVSSVERMESLYASKGKITGVPSGFIDLDSKTTGFHPSDLVLIAARPSMGKSLLALNIAQNATKHNITTALFSLEMSREQMVNRLICSAAMVDAQKLRTGDLDSDDWSKIARAIGPLSEAPLYIDDTPGITAMEIRAKCRKLKAEKNLGLIIIDYLQLMSGHGRNESRQQEISEISRSLKAVAREMDAPVIALSQLSRACETRADHRPMLSDLRESGAIEQDADIVAFIYRDEYYFPDTEKPNQAEIIIAKQRNGPTGTVDLMYLPNFQKFANMERAFT